MKNGSNLSSGAERGPSAASRLSKPSSQAEKSAKDKGSGVKITVRSSLPSAAPSHLLSSPLMISRLVFPTLNLELLNQLQVATTPHRSLTTCPQASRSQIFAIFRMGANSKIREDDWKRGAATGAIQARVLGILRHMDLTDKRQQSKCKPPTPPPPFDRLMALVVPLVHKLRSLTGRS